MAGISIAPSSDWNIAEPDWERLDDVYNVQSWSIDRGRPNEMSRTETGTASIELVDRTGDLDPTNTGGAYYGALVPTVQAKIELQNPVTDAWTTLFRGFIASVRWVPYRSEQHANVTLDLVDGLAILAACEMAPDGSFGHSVDPPTSSIVYNSSEDDDAPLEGVKTRIGKVLDEVGWPGSLREIFTGNVMLQRGVYAPRSSALSVIQDAADAEFPDVANVYIGAAGDVTFHGRFARFNPDNVDYDITTWQLGDNAAADLDTDVVPVSPPLVASLDDTTLFTSAYSTPNDPEGLLTNANLAGQYVTDLTAVGKYGLRTWSAENLLTFGGDDSTTALQETKLYADYVRDNYVTPRVRVGQLTVKPRRPPNPDTTPPDPGGLNAAAVWALLGNIEISDICHLTTTHLGQDGLPSGGGFDTDFYVEGIHYQARPGGTIPYVELTLDVSPRGAYDVPTFGTEPT